MKTKEIVHTILWAQYKFLQDTATYKHRQVLVDRLQGVLDQLKSDDSNAFASGQALFEAEKAEDIRQDRAFFND